MADDLTPRILAEIRDEVRAVRQDLGSRIEGLGDGLRAEITEMRTELLEEIRKTNTNLLLLNAVAQSIDTRVGHLEQWQKEQSFLPRRVDHLEVVTQRHARRLGRLQRRRHEEEE